MKKKNSTIKWMLGILILMAAACWTTQSMQGKNQGLLPAAMNIFSQNGFFRFLGNFIGLHSQGLSRETFKENNTPKQNGPMPTGRQAPASGQTPRPQQNLGSRQTSGTGEAGIGTPQGTGLIAKQRSNIAQQDNNAGNNPRTNTGNNAGNSPTDNSGALLGPNADQKTGNLPGNNPGDSSGSDSGGSSGSDSGGSSGSDSGGSSGSDSGGSSGSDSGGSSGSDSGGSSGGSSDDNSKSPSICVHGCYPGCIPGCDPECAPPECLLANVNQSELSTINPIPSDSTVSKNIANQNQESDALAALLAARQALTIPVEEQAQASKYQTINSQNIPAPSTNQAPADVEQKVQSHQLTYH